MKRPLLFRLAFFGMVGFLFFMSSCNVLNPNIMLRTGRNYKFDTLSKDTAIAKEFVLSPNDIIEFRLFANDGFKMIDIISSTNNSTVLLRQVFEYSIDGNGIVRLPVIGDENLSGLTVRQAELQLERRYSEFYVHPFVQLKIINKRVIIYPGEPGRAQIIPLSNNNTTVLEVIAAAGGISADGKAYNIKLIRQPENNKGPLKVYKLDLSTIDGLNDGNTIVQSGDIIYVEPRRQLANRALKEITPVLSLVSSFITIYFIAKRL